MQLTLPSLPSSSSSTAIVSTPAPHQRHPTPLIHALGLSCLGSLRIHVPSQQRSSPSIPSNRRCNPTCETRRIPPTLCERELTGSTACCRTNGGVEPLEIQLDSAGDLVLRGFSGEELEPAVLKGELFVNLTEATTLKDVQ